MRKILPIALALLVAAALCGCSDDSDHGVNIQRGGFFSNLFGAQPVQPAPAPSLPTAAPAPAPSTGAPGQS